jgi:hypothetical protein
MPPVRVPLAVVIAAVGLLAACAERPAPTVKPPAPQVTPTPIPS